MYKLISTKPINPIQKEPWELKCFTCERLAIICNILRVKSVEVHVCLCPQCQANGRLEEFCERELQKKVW